jgi:hypothetical protein
MLHCLRSLCPSLGLLALVTTGCGDAGSTGGGADAAVGDLAAGGDQRQNPDLAPGLATLWGLSVEVRPPTGGVSGAYVQAVSRAMFDGREIDNSKALEFAGIPRLLTIGGSLFVGPRERPELDRYTVGDDLKLTPAGVVDVSTYGDTYVDIGFIPGIAPGKAYYLNKAQQKGVIVDPAAMKITGTFDISGAQRPGFMGNIQHQGIIQFEAAVVGNLAFESALSSIAATSKPPSGDYYPKVTVDVFDTAADRLLKVAEDDRCYGPSTMVRDDNGDLYVSTYSFTGRVYQHPTVPYKPTCVLRIKAGESEFDKDFFVSFPKLLNGRECTRWYPVNARYSYCTTLTLDDLKAATGANGRPSTSTAMGEIWKIDIQQMTARKVDGLPATSPLITLGYPDGGVAVFLGVAADKDVSRSDVYRLVPATDEVKKVFQVDGYFRGFWPVR